jgi:uncharacterized protein (TIGR03435 family)
MKFVLGASILAVAAFAQQARPEFEVASVKRSADANAPGRIIHMAGERGYRGVNMPLIAYIRVAYQLRQEQISTPDWLLTENYDVEAKTDHSCTADELHAMLQTLLEDRFHMKLHREARTETGYSLTVDGGGQKMKDSDPSSFESVPLMNGPGRHLGKNVTMQYLAFFLSQEIGSTVVDQTGLKGRYDFDVTWGMEGTAMGSMMDAAPSPPGGTDHARTDLLPPAFSGPNIFEALKKQLGLRLEKAKVPVEHLVIDHIEKLTEN